MWGFGEKIKYTREVSEWVNQEREARVTCL